MTSEFDIIRAVVRKALEWQEDSEARGEFYCLTLTATRLLVYALLLVRERY